MQWLAVVLVFSFALGLRRTPGRGAHALLALGVAGVAVAWYLQLGGHGG